MKSDFQLKQDVLEELNWDPAFDSTEVGVQVKDGVVTLTGHLDTSAAKYAAVAAVRRVAGVKALAVEVDVRLQTGLFRSDAEVAWAAANVLSWNTMVPTEQVKVTVENGVVTLAGEVDWNYQRLAAEHAVVGLLGVRSVRNALVIREQADRADLDKRIREAIARQAVSDASHVSVTVTGGTVTLRGSLRTWAERDAATEAAWSAPGVSGVNNDIRVNL